MVCTDLEILMLVYTRFKYQRLRKSLFNFVQSGSNIKSMSGSKRDSSSTQEMDIDNEKCKAGNCSIIKILALVIGHVIVMVKK